MAEFAQRPMVAQGMPPSAPSAVGTGITSGLVPENNDPIIQQGMEQFENTVGNLYTKLDQSESIEDVMNSVRGDEQPMKARVDELAELVGETDAKKTPESVLAVMQPYFQILEMVQSQASDAAPGGIADAPMAGGRQSTVNFNNASPIQAPGSDEAAMRIAMGETPVNFAHGGYHAPQVLSGQMSPSYRTFPFPELEMPKYNVDDITNIAKTYMDAQTNLGYEKAPTDTAQIMANQNKFLQPFMIEPRSQEEILAEQQALFGDQDQKDLETQGSLALAKFGAGVAQTPGSLLQALTANVPMVATDMSKIAAQKAALDRQQKEFAYSTAAAEEREERTTNLNLALDAVKTSAANGKSNMVATNAAINAGIELGIADAQTMAKQVNQEKLTAFNAQMIWAGKDEKIFSGKDASGNYTSVRVVEDPGGQGLMAIDENNPLKLLPIPKGFRETTKSDHLAAVNSGKTDWSKAQKTTFTIPSKTSPDGWAQVEGVFVPSEGYYLTADGGYENAVRPPKGSIVGPKSSVVKVSETPDGVGRIFTTVTPPNGAAFSYISKVVRRQINEETGEIEFVTTDISDPAYQLRQAEFTKNDAGVRIYQGGNPLVHELAPVGIPAENLDAATITRLQKNVASHVVVLDAGQKLLDSLPDTIGPIATLKAISTNNVAAFLPEGALKELSQHFKTLEGREALALFERTIQTSLALSDRYAVAEQEIIAQLVPKLSFFKDPEASMVELQGFLVNIQNRLANTRHRLDPAKTPRLNITTPPSGQPDDPFKFYDDSLPAGPTSHFDYLNMMASDAKSPIDLSKINVSITGPQLEYLLRNSTLPNKESAYKKSDGSYKDNILINANQMVDLTR
jgi:hypothetical protein